LYETVSSAAVTVLLLFKEICGLYETVSSAAVTVLLLGTRNSAVCMKE
jgi:hypothetical protein